MKIKSTRIFDNPLASTILELLKLEDTVGVNRKYIKYWLKRFRATSASSATIDAALGELVAAGIVRREIVFGREHWFAAWSHHNEYMLKNCW